MSYNTIDRVDTIGSATISKLVPSGGHYVSSYAFLLQRGESLHLNDFAARIEAQYDNPRCKIEAGEIRRWVALMDYAEDHLKHFGALPLEFEWEDGLYSYDDNLKILGDEAVTWLLTNSNAA